MRQASFAQFTCVGIDASNLLEARMIITSYNQHVRLLSSEPFGWFAPPKFTRPWEPTLFMESFQARRHGSTFQSLRHRGCDLYECIFCDCTQRTERAGTRQNPESGRTE